MSVDKLLKKSMILLLCSVVVCCYCVHLKKSQKGKIIHETKGVFPQGPLLDISNFAQPVNTDVHTQKTDYDTIKDYCKKSLKFNG